MEKLVEYRRVLIALALVVLLALMLPVSVNELPAGMVVIGLEAFVIGLLPLALGFVAQLALGNRELRDRVLLLCAIVVTLAFDILVDGFSDPSPVRHVINAVFLTLLLTWFAGLGAASVRAIRRNRHAKAEAAAPEA